MTTPTPGCPGCDECREAAAALRRRRLRGWRQSLRLLARAQALAWAHLPIRERQQWLERAAAVTPTQEQQP